MNHSADSSSKAGIAGSVMCDAREVRRNVVREPFEEVVRLVAEVLQDDFLDTGVGKFTQVVDKLLGGAHPRRVATCGGVIQRELGIST